MAEWKQRTSYIPKYIKIYSLEETIDLPDHSTILFPLYKDPIPNINHFLNLKAQKFLCGPLVLMVPEKIISNISCDGLIGNEPVISLLDENSRIMTDKNIPKNFYKIENDKLPNIEIPWFVKNNNELQIFPESYATCQNRCSFCQIGQNLHLQKNNKKYTFDQILSRIGKYELNPYKQAKVSLNYVSIFDALEVDEIRYLLHKIHEKFKYQTINLWARTASIIKYQEILHTLSPKKINWNIGFEAFNRNQLKRYNKSGLKHNLEVLEIINKQKLHVSPLMIMLDPWSTNQELAENFYYLSKINKINLACGQSGMIWNGNILNRLWIPYPNTNLTIQAKNENLLNLERFNEFDYPFSQDIKNPNTMSWHFKNQIRPIIDNLLNFNYIMDWTKQKLTETGKSGCSFCSGGLVFNHNKTGRVFQDMEEQLVEYISTMNENLYSKIMNKITILAEEILNG
mgnify:CR=1 FL=1